MNARWKYLILLMLLPQAVVVADERFPFLIPGDDATPSVTNLSHLSPAPAGADGFVRIRDGRFATESGRLKIWGVNTCFGANFPAREDAEKVAAHLAKLGVNGLRMHHHDTAPSPRGVWGPVVDGRRTLDPQQLDRQDYFLDQLHRHGIYVNLNLHVGRAMTEQEGFVTEDLPYAVRYNKYLLYFEPRMREQLKQFCRDYLTRYNPYRERKRSEDPGIAMVEITNENSFSRLGPGIAATLPEPYRAEFQGQWNRWLADRYENTAALKQAWGGRNEPLGEPLADSTAWRTDLGQWRLRQSAQHPVRRRIRSARAAAGHARAHIASQHAGSRTPATRNCSFRIWNIEPGQIYTLSFWVRAEAANARWWRTSRTRARRSGTTSDTRRRCS
jgi:hypothetical protein